MFELVTGLPPNVLAIEARGTITHEDCRDTLIPRAEAMMAAGPIRVLHVVGPGFERFDAGALWDDGRFGLTHLCGFERIAVVTDLARLRTSVTVFRPFMPCPVRLFALAELTAAKDWIVAASPPHLLRTPAPRRRCRPRDNGSPIGSHGGVDRR